MKPLELRHELPRAREVILLSGAGRVLAEVLEDPQATLREIARRCGRTERSAWQLMDRLELAGLVRRTKHGRRNHYEVDLLALERQLLGEASPLLAAAGHLSPQRHQRVGLALVPATA